MPSNAESTLPWLFMALIAFRLLASDIAFLGFTCVATISSILLTCNSSGCRTELAVHEENPYAEGTTADKTVITVKNTVGAIVGRDRFLLWEDDSLPVGDDGLNLELLIVFMDKVNQLMLLEGRK